MLRFLLPAFLALIAMHGPAAAQGSGDNRGTLLWQMVVNDNDDRFNMMQFASRSETGRWRVVRGYVNVIGLTGEAKLPPGNYAIVEVTAPPIRMQSGLMYRYVTYQCRAGEPTYETPLLYPAYDKAIATFTVKPGEVVDIGTLRVRASDKTCVAQVGPTPATKFKELAEKQPALYKARVVRPMTVAR